jgi:hypothetical protein
VCGHGMTRKITEMGRSVRPRNDTEDHGNGAGVCGHGMTRKITEMAPEFAATE